MVSKNVSIAEDVYNLLSNMKLEELGQVRAGIKDLRRSAGERPRGAGVT